MNEHADQAKGKIKEKVGEMIGDRDLENEGKVDQAKACRLARLPSHYVLRFR